MATIHITKQHNLNKKQVKNAVQQLAEQLSEELSAETSWEDDRLVFKRSGARGHIDLGDSEVEVEIKLSMVLSPLKGKIEKTVQDYLDERLS